MTQRETLVLRNDKAVVLWIFLLAWDGMLIAFTWIYVRDGGMPGAGGYGGPVLALFWLAGLGLAAWVCTLPRVRVEVRGRQVTVTERYLLRRESCALAPTAVGLPAVEQIKDSDGDPYFRCVLELPRGRRVIVAEGSHRDAVAEQRERLRVALEKVDGGSHTADRRRQSD